MRSILRKHAPSRSRSTTVGVYRKAWTARVHLAIAVSLVVAGSPAIAGPTGTLPELPREHVDTELGQSSGRKIRIGAGEDLQAALNSARLGDVIILQEGATYSGPFVLPKKEGSGWLVVRTSAADSSLASGGILRASPSAASHMARLIAPRGPVVSVSPGAHHYYFIGLEVSPTPDTYLYSLVAPEVEPRTEAEQFHHVVFDRCYLHGDPGKGSRRAVVMNGRHLAVIHSHLSDFKEVGADSQALIGWNGSGPFKIVDNYLEGAGENVMFGGADPAIPDLVPSDIEIRGNTFAKNPRWNPSAAAHDESRWTVKALLELKNARRVLIEGNVLESTWDNALLFTPRNQSGTAPWSTVENVTVRYNWFRRVYSIVRILGADNEHPSRPSGPILMEHNVAEDLSVGGDSNPKAMVLLGGPNDVTIRHNTILTTPDRGSSFLFLAGARAKRGNVFTFRDNIVDVGAYGIIAEDPGLGPTGDNMLDGHFETWSFAPNVLIGSLRVETGRYPRGQAWVRTLNAVGFVDLARADLRLGPTSRYRGTASDGTDPGADIGALGRAMAQYMSVPSPSGGQTP